MPNGSSTTLSVRLVLPFVRVCGADPRSLLIAKEEGIQPMLVTAPDVRLPHHQVMRLLSRLVQELPDPQLGLRAGAVVKSGDLYVVEDAVLSQVTLRSAAECLIRYYRLLHDGCEFALVQRGNAAMWRYSLADGLEEPPAAHDFVVSCLSTYVSLCTGRDEPKLAVHFAHNERTNLDEYKRLFRCPIEFNMPYTGVVFPAERLNWPLSQPTVLLGEAFEARARDRLAQIDEQTSAAGFVRKTLLASMESGEITMTSVARRLGISVPTLRRQLALEHTTHSAILDDVRKELAVKLLTRGELSAAKIALFLRFSDPTTFHRAFRRWTGVTPSEYRRSKA